MKALHIMYQCGLCGVGGATAAATRLHLQMLEQGVDSRIACAWNTDKDLSIHQSSLPPSNQPANPPNFQTSIYCLWTRWWWFWSCVLHRMTGKWTHALDLPGFDELFAGFRPDEVHVHWIRRDTISWRQWKRMNDEEWVMKHCGGNRHRMFVHLHDLWPLEQRQVTSLNPTFIAYSDYVANLVRARGYAVERRYLILDPVYSKDVGSTVRRLPSPLTKIILFGCKDGRQNPDKGYGDLVKALALLPAEVQKKIELRIFGEDAEHARNSSSFPIRCSLNLLGRIDDPLRLREEYRKARCFAFPSVHETMGMTKLEALACGCPVVAFDREACAEGIVHGVNGYVARKDDIADFANGLMQYVGDGIARCSS